MPAIPCFSVLDAGCLMARDAIGAPFVSFFAGVAVSALLPTLQLGSAPLSRCCLSEEDPVPTGDESKAVRFAVLRSDYDAPCTSC